jgi:hypothetical protein
VDGKFVQIWSSSICGDGETCEMKHIPQKLQEAYYKKKAKATIIMDVRPVNYGKTCSKSTISKVRHHI